MTCESPWTDRDEYGVYDCHIWNPFYLISAVLVITLGSISSGIALWNLTKELAVRRSHAAKRRSQAHSERSPGHPLLPLFALLANLCLVGVYITRILTGLVLNDRNVVFNLMFSIAGGLYWIFLILVALRYVEISLLMVNWQETLGDIERRSKFLLVLIFLVTIFVFVAPCFLPTSLVQGQFISTACFLGLISLIFYPFAYKLRTRLDKAILIAHKDNKGGYQLLLDRVNRVLVQWTLTALPSIALCIIVLFMPVFAQNMYILVNGFNIIVTPLVMFLVLATRSSEPKKGTPLVNPPSSSSTKVFIHELPQKKKKNKSANHNNNNNNNNNDNNHNDNNRNDSNIHNNHDIEMRSDQSH